MEKQPGLNLYVAQTFRHTIMTPPFFHGSFRSLYLYVANRSFPLFFLLLSRVSCALFLPRIFILRAVDLGGSLRIAREYGEVGGGGWLLVRVLRTQQLQELLAHKFKQNR